MPLKLDKSLLFDLLAKRYFERVVIFDIKHNLYSKLREDIENRKNEFEYFVINIHDNLKKNEVALRSKKKS